MGGTEEIVVTYVRFEHSLLRFAQWPPGFGSSVYVTNAVRPEDEAEFQATLDAIAILAPTD